MVVRRQKDYEFKASLHYVERRDSKQNSQIKTKDTSGMLNWLQSGEAYKMECI